MTLQRLKTEIIRVLGHTYNITEELLGTSWLTCDVIGFFSYCLSAEYPAALLVGAWWAESLKPSVSRKADWSDLYIQNAFMEYMSRVLGDYQDIFVPCNIQQLHWVLIHVDKRSEQVYFYDGLFGGKEARGFAGAMVGFLRALAPGKNWSLAPRQSGFRQEDHHNCGVIVCRIMELVARRDGKFCMTPDLLTGKSLGAYRLRIARHPRSGGLGG